MLREASWPVQAVGPGLGALEAEVVNEGGGGGVLQEAGCACCLLGV